MLFFDVTFNIYLTAQSTHSINITACMGASSLLNCQHPTQSCLRRVHLRLSSQCTELRGGSSAHAHHCGGDEFIMAGLVQRVVHINIVDFGFLSNNRCWEGRMLYIICPYSPLAPTVRGSIDNACLNAGEGNHLIT